MPRTRSLAWSELKIGVLTIVAIAIAAVLDLQADGHARILLAALLAEDAIPECRRAGVGSPVRVAGVEVGSVTEIAFAGEQVDVTFQVQGHRDRITTASVAKLGSVSLLGESAVDVTPATTGTPIPEWGYVPPGTHAARVADVTDQASAGHHELTGLIQDMRGGRARSAS